MNIWTVDNGNNEYRGHLLAEEMVFLYFYVKLSAMASTNVKLSFIALNVVVINSANVIANFEGTRKCFDGMAKIAALHELDGLESVIVRLAVGESFVAYHCKFNCANILIRTSAKKQLSEHESEV